MPRAKATKTETKPYTRPSPSPSTSDGGDPNTPATGNPPKPATKDKSKGVTRGKPTPNRKPRSKAKTVEAESDDDDTKPDVSDVTTKRRTAGKTWTNAEYIALFTHIVAHARRSGTGVFDGAVEGRTRNQTYLTWKVTVEPYIRKMLAEKSGKGGKGGKEKRQGKDEQAGVKDELDVKIETDGEEDDVKNDDDEGDEKGDELDSD